MNQAGDHWILRSRSPSCQHKRTYCGSQGLVALRELAPGVEAGLLVSVVAQTDAREHMRHAAERVRTEGVDEVVSDGAVHDGVHQAPRAASKQEGNVGLRLRLRLRRCGLYGCSCGTG
jgi:hypothetical protein